MVMQKLFKLAAAIALFAMSGCDESRKDCNGSYVPDSDGRIILEDGGAVYKISIDGHDYLIYSHYPAGGICHSESCRCRKAD